MPERPDSDPRSFASARTPERLPGSRSLLAVAVPIALSNLSTPLLGIVDTGVVGQLGDPAFIGAVAVGAMIFNFIYWAFGFLRMGTTGMTAQACGACDADEIQLALIRPTLIAAVIGVVLIACQSLLGWLAFALLRASPEVEEGARHYFAIRIWSAPFALANYALLGWFIGRRQSRVALLLQLVLNGLNAVLDAAFVLVLDWGIEGIAKGTLLAEICAALFGTSIALRRFRALQRRIPWRAVFHLASFGRCLVVNKEIMVRTLFLLCVFAFFTAKSAEFGNVLLATNTILMHFLSFTAFFLDGFALAAEAFVGEAIGRRSRKALLRSIVLSSVWSAGTAVLLTLLIYLFGPFVIDLLSQSSAVRAESRHYLPWVVGLPLVSFGCWQLDGIFIGATRTHEMERASFQSMLAFLLCWWLFRDLENHGLWLAMILFNALRAVFLGRYLPGLLRSVDA